MAADVQDFYERYPYPRPVDDLEKYARLWADPARRRADYRLFWPSRPYRDDYRILIAGCGTSQAAKHALRWPAARVVGIDFSTNSVRHTEALKRTYRLDNLEIYQLPIERVRELETSFDQIVCTGVLHHLTDPDAGLAALQDVLEPDGAMHLMVYAPYGRTGIYMLQEFCRLVGIPATDAGIRDLIGALAVLPPGHPLGSVLRAAPDFREEAGLADALLHPQDRAYSVPQLFDYLARAGLTFGRWLRQAPYSPRCGAMTRLVQTSRITEVPLVDQFAAVELFRGTMVRHNLIAHRADRPQPAHDVHFCGDAWRQYVPLRLAETMCLDEQLPAGAAGMLINRTHVYGDIYLPIDAKEKRFFDAIDGMRSVAEIARDWDGDAARTFIERLWWHDHVVFDASTAFARES